MSFEDIDYVRIGEEHGYDRSMVKDLFEKWQHSIGDRSVEDPEGEFSEFLTKEYESDAEGETVDTIIEGGAKNIASSMTVQPQKSAIKKKVKLVKKKQQQQPRNPSAVIEARFGDDDDDDESDDKHLNNTGEDFEWSSKDIRTDEGRIESESVYKTGTSSSSLAFKENTAASSVEAALKSHNVEGGFKHTRDRYGMEEYSSSDDDDDDYSVSEEDERKNHAQFDLDAARRKYGLIRKVGDSMRPNRVISSKPSKQKKENTSSALESWDDIVDAIEDLSEEEDDDTPYASSGIGSEKAQEKLRDMLVGEAMRINDDITTSNLVLALIPDLSVSEKILDNVTKSRKEKTKFVTGNLITMTGSQPETQLFDRPYRAIDGSEYNWPSTGSRRLVGQRKTVYIGSTENKITNKHGKAIKPVYIADSK